MSKIIYSRGTQIAYIPTHIKIEHQQRQGKRVDIFEDMNTGAPVSHNDVEFGFIYNECRSVNVLPDGTLKLRKTDAGIKWADDLNMSYWCLFWVKKNSGTLRTVAKSELTPAINLIPYKSVDQKIVIATMAKIRLLNKRF